MTPIEELFWIAAKSNPIAPYCDGLTYQHDRDLTDWFERELSVHVMIAPQVISGPYTVDFAVWGRREGGGNMFVVVECDGHDFHERTKEQARHDRSRDRFFLKQGITVLRFTGSEIWKDAKRCFSDVVELLTNNDANGIGWTGALPTENARSAMVELNGLFDAGVIDERAHFVSMSAFEAVGSDGVGRVSFEVLEKTWGIRQSDLPSIAEELHPFIRMKTIDTDGRIVFRFCNPEHGGFADET